MTTQITSSKAVNAAIKAVRRTKGAYEASVQDAIVIIITHAQTYSDCTGAARLVAEMPQSNRRSLVIAHFSDYSPINVRKDKDGTFVASIRKPDDTKYKAYNVEGVKANLWHQRPEAAKLPDTITYQTALDDFDKWCEAELRKAAKVKTEAEGIENAATKANRLTDADNIIDFVARLRKTAKAPVLTSVPAEAAAAA